MARLVQDSTNPTNAEHLTAIILCRDEFLGTLMLNGANKEKFGALKTDLSNQYCFGNDLYPKSPDQCLSFLNSCTDVQARSPRNPTPTVPTPVKQKDLALVFAQGADK